MGKTVAVIGSGLAGAITAIALKKQGFEPTLYDKVDPLEVLKETVRTGEVLGIQFGEVGGDLTILGNGIKALQHLGLQSVLDEIQSDESLEEMSFLLLDGSDRIPKKTQKKGEVKPVQVLRSNLHAALMKAVHKAGIKAFAGKKIANLTQTENDVTVTFEDGTIVVSDFVVGADGIHSKTRRLLFPDAPKPEAFATGYVGVLDIGTRPNGVVVDFEYPGGVYSDPLNSRLVFGARCGKDIGAFFVADLNPAKLFDAGDDWRPYTDLPKESAKLADLVASWGTNESVVTCIRYAKRITPANLYDLPNLSAFHKGRVVLVGDSAHGTVPFYGQGLNQAIEDAGVLSDLFGHFEDDYKKVFEVYDKIRVPRTRLCSASARKTAARMKASSKIDLKIGRFMMKLVFNILSLIGADDEVYFHDYRDDVKKAIPDIQFK
ncbi:hypothetical protein HDU79_011774 [Rhizoclosmatium sp. JEL0117]|nr:hypothetical protein HDU79_011774 [Rhizoclosmatium sp. JEL0117]